MTHDYTAIIRKDAGRWTGWIKEVPAIRRQEGSLEDLYEALEEAVKENLALPSGVIPS